MRVVTRPIAEVAHPDLDLDAFAGADGVLHVRDRAGLAGQGVAARISSVDARRFLESIEVDDSVRRPGSGPVLIGCVPFDAGAAHDFLLPQRTVVRAADGAAWATFVVDDDGSTPDFSPAPVTRARTGSFDVGPGVPVDHYLAAVTAVRDAALRGDVIKAVIARDLIVHCSEPIDPAALVVRLRASFGSSYRFLVDRLVGASPELLVSINGREVASHPLAGTAPRTGDAATDDTLASALVASTKNQAEHRVVIDAVHDALLPHCSYLDWEPEPSIVRVANVQHLGTRMEGQLADPPLHVLDAVHLLSPTPALGGHPRDAALALIAQVEGMERGRYGGAVGWFDRDGNGTFAVAIRCAELSADRRIARLFAGGGIVAQSDPEAELAETQAKFQAMLAAIVRP
jgi:menaquinone-specific isochorismate synthase